MKWLSWVAAAVLLTGCGSSSKTSGSGGGGAAGAGGSGGSVTHAGGGGSVGAGGRGGSGGNTGEFAISAGDEQIQDASQVRVDENDNIIVSGAFRGTIDFGNNPLSTSTDGNDSYLVQFDPNGQHLWSTQLNTASGFNRMLLAARPVDDIVAGGHYNGSFTLGGTAFDAGPGGDLYAAKWSNDGQLQWVRSFSCDEDGYVSAVAVDSNANIVLGGSFSGTCVFDGVMLTAQIRDGYIVKLDPAGNVLWGRQIGGPVTGDAVWGAGFDAAGNVIVSGQFRDATDFGSGTAVTPNGLYDLFVARYDAAGSYLSHTVIDWEGTGYLDAFRMEADDAGRAVMAGQFETITFDVPLSGSVDNQIFAAALDAMDQPDFAAAYGELNDEDHVRGIGIGPNGALALAGTGGPLDFGGGTLPGLATGFMAVLSDTGAHIFSERLGNVLAVSPEDAALDHSNNIIVVGSFQQPTDFGYGTLTPSGPRDLFILKRPLP